MGVTSLVAMGGEGAHFFDMSEKVLDFRRDAPPARARGGRGDV